MTCALMALQFSFPLAANTYMGLDGTRRFKTLYELQFIYCTVFTDYIIIKEMKIAKHLNQECFFSFVLKSGF